MTELVRVQKAIAMPNGDWLVYGPERSHRQILKKVPPHVEEAMLNDFDAMFHGTWDSAKKKWDLGARADLPETKAPSLGRGRAAKAPPPELRKTIHIIKTINPRQINSKGWHSYNLYKEGMRVSDFISLGGRIGDVRWDLNAKHITLEEPKE